MRILLGVVSISFFISCIPQGIEKQPELSVVNQTEEVCKVLMSIWESGDTSRVAEIFHIESEYVDIPNGQIFKGQDGAKKIH